MPRQYAACLARVHNRRDVPPAFLDEMIDWARTAPDELFAKNNRFDIYSKVSNELGPYERDLQRRAVMLEVLRVLAGFESSWNWNEGIDTSRASSDTPENSEAGAWQTSYDARKLAPELKGFLEQRKIRNGIQFQQEMKSNHPLAMHFVSLLLRFNTKHNGPLYKGDERPATWPDRPKLWAAEESIYPWLSRAAVTEFQAHLNT